MKRTLSLKREALAELSTSELTSVVGGMQAITVEGTTCPIKFCPGNLSLQARCSWSCPTE